MRRIFKKRLLINVINLWLISSATQSQMVSAETPEISNARKDGIWGTITGRSTGRIYRLFARYPILKMASGKTFNVADAFAAAMTAAESCDESVLSLGEGRSTLISGLLYERKSLIKMYGDEKDPTDHSKLCGFSNIHAVDVSYPDHDEQGNITDNRKADAGNLAETTTYDEHMVELIQQYPNNYHSQLFQNLDIKAPDGQQKKFTKIISSHSLNYVLSNKNLSENTRLEIVKKIIGHMAPGAVLMIFPMTLNDTDEFTKKFYQFLADLNKANEIHDYTVQMGSLDKPLTWALIK